VLEKAAAKNGSTRRRRQPASHSNLNRKSFSKGTGEFHTPAVQPARGRGAAEPRVDHPAEGSFQPRAARATWKKVNDQVVDGLSLAEAMAKSPETFPRVYGRDGRGRRDRRLLDVVLAQIAEFQAREKEPEVEGADGDAVSVHPARAGAGRSSCCCSRFSSRNSQSIFSNMHAALPLITQIIIGASHIVRSYGLLVAGALIGIVSWCARGSSLKRASASGRDSS